MNQRWGRGWRPSQDLFQIQLHKHFLGSLTVSANSARCLGTTTATVKFFGSTLVFLQHPPLSCYVTSSVSNTLHLLSLLVVSGLVGSSKELKRGKMSFGHDHSL